MEPLGRPSSSRASGGRRNVDIPYDVKAHLAFAFEQARTLNPVKVFQAESEHMRATIEALQRHQLCRGSKQLGPGQLRPCPVGNRKCVSRDAACQKLVRPSIFRSYAEGQLPIAICSRGKDRTCQRAEDHLADFADGFGGYAAFTKRRQQAGLAVSWASRAAQVLWNG